MILVVCKLCTMGFTQGWGGLLLIEGNVLTGPMQMATVHNLEEEHVKALTSSIGVSYAACAATAGTTLVIGYGFGFRGGRWFTLRKIQKQQQRLLNPRTPIRLSQVLRGKKAAGERPNSSKAENVSKMLEGARSA
jgi:hypothetical protein